MTQPEKKYDPLRASIITVERIGNGAIVRRLMEPGSVLLTADALAATDAGSLSDLIADWWNLTDPGKP